MLCIWGQFSKYKPPGGLYLEGLIFGILRYFIYARKKMKNTRQGKSSCLHCIICKFLSSIYTETSILKLINVLNKTINLFFFCFSAVVIVKREPFESHWLLWSEVGIRINYYYFFFQYINRWSLCGWMLWFTEMSKTRGLLLLFVQEREQRTKLQRHWYVYCHINHESIIIITWLSSLIVHFFFLLSPCY